ncbi:hypothetical protein PtB15_9B569 [Puccinia triticina]|nr:hypothetical protein PtB15_9B569 [Puccinia triticina]
MASRIPEQHEQIPPTHRRSHSLQASTLRPAYHSRSHSSTEHHPPSPNSDEQSPPSSDSSLAELHHQKKYHRHHQPSKDHLLTHHLKHPHTHNTHHASRRANAILIAALTITASLSSILLAIATTQLAQLPLATLPILEFLALSLITRLPILNLHIQNPSDPSQPQPPATQSAASSPPSTHPRPYRFAGWRLLLRFTLPTALLSLLSSWARTEIAGRAGCGTWQAFDIYALPIAVLALSRLPSIKQPSPQLVGTVSVLAFTVTLQFYGGARVYPFQIVLGVLSATSQALYLAHLKTWLLSFPQQSPTRALAHSAPLALLMVVLPLLATTVYETLVSRTGPTGVVGRLSMDGAVWLALYLVARLAERLLELWIVARFRSPMAVLLVVPPRNLLSLGLAEAFRVYVGRLGSAQAAVSYLAAIAALVQALPDLARLGTHAALVLRNRCASHPRLLPAIRRRSSTYTDHDADTVVEKSPDQERSSLEHHRPDSRPHIHHHRRHQRDNNDDNNDEDDDEEEEEEDDGYGRQSSPARFRKPFGDGTGYRCLRRRRQKAGWAGLFRVVAFGPLCMLLLLELVWQPPVGVPVAEPSTGTLRKAGSVDLVFSYYNEPLTRFFEAVDHVRRRSVLSLQNPRVVVYVKHPDTSLTTIANVVGADEVVRLPNVGREGGTYLTHILKHYNASLGPLASSDPAVLESPQFGTERLLAAPPVRGLADHTVFMQPEISWHWIAKPRMDLFDPSSTGFLSFGPYLVSVCGQDGLGNGNYERMRDIYTMFYNSFCPPTGQLASYAGQFVVSRRRILANSYTQYGQMRALLEAPTGHWIHREGGWLKWKGATDTGPAEPPTGPRAPFLGHALERSWPVVFGCSDPAVAEACTDDVNDKALCQCSD